MNISGIHPSVGFYNYNSISTETVKPSAPVEAVAKVEDITTEDAKSLIEEQEAAAKKQTFGAYDYAKAYNPDETYELKGMESDIKSLDVQKAISGMQKDDVLHQYQFFVGNQPKDVVPSMRGAENFSL